jgi:hypothetical protein
MDLKELFDNASNDPTLLSNVNVNELLNSLENKNNDYLENKTFTDIHNEKFNALTELDLPDETIRKYCDKLAEFRLVEEIYELHKGKYVRWINKVKDTNYKLYGGGFVLDVKFNDNGLYILCMNNAPRKIIQFKFDDCLTFQKLSTQEQIILMAYEKI